MTFRCTFAVPAFATALVGCFNPPAYPDAADLDETSSEGDASADVGELDDSTTGDVGCESEPCSGHGICSADDQGTPSCACEPPYAGADCSGCAFGFQDHDGDGTCAVGCDHPDAPSCDELQVCDDQDGSADCDCELEVEGECVAARTVTVMWIGDGRGDVSVDGQLCEQSPCEFLVAAGSEVSLIATPRDALHRFVGWSGPCSAADGGCILTVDEDVTLSATFELRNNVVFVSAQALGVDQLAALPGPGLSVPERADAWCAREAMEAGLHGTQWVAWLVTSALTVPERMGDARGWVSTDGRPVADRLEHVLTGALDNPILFNQFGERHNVVAWSGADLEGGTDQYSDACLDWTSNAADQSASAGSSGSSRLWAVGLGIACSESAHLYCFGIDSSEALPSLPAVPGRIAFVSRGLFTPGDGRAIADAICQQEAAEHFEGEFVAALGTSTEPVAERFDLDGPTWVRPDGRPIFAQASDLSVADRGISSVHQHADGIVVDLTAFNWVRTGWCEGDPSLCCDDWNGVVGYTFAQSLFDDALSSSGTSVACNEAGRVFCLQR